MKPRTIATVKNMLDELKIRACHSARFDRPVSVEMYDNRKKLKLKPFRCMAYNMHVRRINALTELIDHFPEGT